MWSVTCTPILLLRIDGPGWVVSRGCTTTTAQLLGSPAHEDPHFVAQQEGPDRQPFTRSFEWRSGGTTWFPTCCIRHAYILHTSYVFSMCVQIMYK